jgi:CRISPR-associated protein Cmr6
MAHPLHPNGQIPSPDRAASFVEYLRWMREFEKPGKDGTKTQILELAQERANYRDRLNTLTQRTRLIAGPENVFEVTCSWRVRVGGHRGPESILLPAFDALGMPYIPSSTLRGVARAQAIRHFMAEEHLDWKNAERRIAPYFGDLDAEDCDRMGKVIFLDAYPLPSEANGGLAVDIANNIWSWKEDALSYAPNPNAFFSLKGVTFVVGLRPMASCSANTLAQVKQWLMAGLQAGVGSQANTGYGQLLLAGHSQSAEQFFQVRFSLEGQLIHGRQKFTQWSWYDKRQEWQMRGQAEAEVRPVAFKSMLRYWFRAFALGVLSVSEVKQWEARLFGSITPQVWGWVSVGLEAGKVDQREPKANQQGKDDPCGKQSGLLQLSYSSGVSLDKRECVKALLTQLTWMMFHLGGIGQGARRPCYSRKTRERAPWWRGSTLLSEEKDSFWDLPDTVLEFQRLFQQRLQTFYSALATLTGREIRQRSPLKVGSVKGDRWTEAIDGNCRMFVCAGNPDYGKPFALGMLHSQEFKVRNRKDELDYDGNLCGQVQGGVKPSPVWIADLDGYQLVTIFGATQDPRQKYVKALCERATEYQQIWPFQ